MINRYQGDLGGEGRSEGLLMYVAEMDGSFLAFEWADYPNTLDYDFDQVGG